MTQFLQTDATEPRFRPESAWLEHGPFITWLVRKMRPRRFVELGTHFGYSYFAVCETVLNEGLSTQCIAVDTWQGDAHAGFYDETASETVQGENARYAAFSTLQRKTFDEALADVEDGSVDLLHIDGRHFYEDVRHDYESWLPKLAPDAVVLFHDTEVRDRGFGVYRLWADLARTYPSFNFVHGNGLGILFHGEKVPTRLTEMVALSAANGGPGVIEDYFQLLGGLMSERAAVRSRYGELEDQVAQLEQAYDVNRRALQEAKEANQRALQEAKEANQRALQEAKEELAQVTRAARFIAEKAAKAERRPFQTLSRRAGYGLAKSLLKLPMIERRVGASLRKIVTKHSPNRYHALVPGSGRGVEALPGAVPTASFSFMANGSSSGGGIASDAGRYQLSTKSQGYTYVPPMPPPNLAVRISALSHKPQFTVIMPTYNTPPTLLHKAIASLKAQWYGTWHLIVVDDCSTDPETQRALDALTEDQITLIRHSTNGGISAATNTAIAHAEGDYVVFLDHDDELTPDCMWELALAINRSDADFIYSDEDKIDTAGRFVQPFFKPDWSPDALMNTMYTCHVSCVRTALLKSVGPLKPEYDGAQDWDIILRVTEQATRIYHIPKVLYHWRIIPGSISGAQDAKPAAIERSRSLREEALARRGQAGALEPLDVMPSAFRPRYDADPATRLSVIIPTRDNGDLVRACISSIMTAKAWENTEFIVVDNGSSDPATLDTLIELSSMADVRVLRHDHPFNYAELNTAGIAVAKGDVILHLNDDTEIINPDAISRMIGYARLPHIGAVGARLLYPGGTLVQHAGILNLENGPSHAFCKSRDTEKYYYLRNHLDYNWLAVTGACLMVERSKLEEVEGWDHGFPVAYNDVDLCFRLRKAGYHNVVSQASRFIHHESLTRGLDDICVHKKIRLRKDWERLYEKHPDFYLRDPYVNPNLHPNGTFFELPDSIRI